MRTCVRYALQVLEELVRLRRQIDLLELEFSALAARFAETEEYKEHGSVTPLDCIRHNCFLSLGDAGHRVAVGRTLRALTASVDAMAEGRIGFGHLVKLARTKEALLLRFDEPALLAEAEQASVGRFHFICEQARHAATPKRVAEEQADAAERRSLEIFGHEDGMVSLRGLFDGFAGAAIRNALEPMAERCGKDDERPKWRRLADAMVELAQGKEPPQLMVTVAAETLLDLPGTPGGELQYSPPIPLPTLERLRCDCVLQRVVLKDKSVVIDAGRNRRLVSPSQRRALQVRDKQCRWPGCTRPARFCTPHHLRPWSEGGGTSVAESLMLCGRHHWLVHEGGWTVAYAEDGTTIVAKPPPRVWSLARGPGVAA
jgi:hypothetical protein